MRVCERQREQRWFGGTRRSRLVQFGDTLDESPPVVSDEGDGGAGVLQHEFTLALVRASMRVLGDEGVETFPRAVGTRAVGNALAKRAAGGESRDTE